MIEAGIWADRKQWRKQVHQPRHRRECVGEWCESTIAYFHAARAYLEAWGKPVAFYSDNMHGVFRVNHPGALGGEGMIQFGRALHALNIGIICANSSPTKSLPLA